jgi:hypothetical protein
MQKATVWRSLFGNDCQLVIDDFDIAFVDGLGNRSQELTATDLKNR